MIVSELWRYPVKGLQGERLGQVAVSPRRALPLDRKFALAHGNSGITPDDPEWALKTEFHMLMHKPDARLCELAPRFDEASGELTILHNGAEAARAKVDEAAGQSAMSEYFGAFLGTLRTGAPRFMKAEGFYFGNIEEQVISLINLASVRDFAAKVGKEVDARRMRGNILVEGLEPWEERAWVGETLTSGELTFRVVDETIRCGATLVNPATSERDLNVPKLLKQHYGHMFCGVYLVAHQSGTLSEGDAISMTL